jgi:hypothetical protein
MRGLVALAVVAGVLATAQYVNQLRQDNQYKADEVEALRILNKDQAKSLGEVDAKLKAAEAKEITIVVQPDSKESDESINKSVNQVEQQKEDSPKNGETISLDTLVDSSSKSDKPEIQWVPWTAAPALARSFNKPSWIYFTGGASCLPCENFRRNVATDPDVIKALEEFVCVKFELADRPEDNDATTKAAIKAFGIDLTDGIPQHVFLLPGWDGRNYKNLGGVLPKDAKGFAKYFTNWADYFNRVKEKEDAKF